MKPPIEPKEEDCCNSGCNPCIFEVYEKQLQIYKSYIESGIASSNSIKENLMSPTEYKKFFVIENVNICKQHRLLLFKHRNLETKKVFWDPGEHFLVKYQSDKNICTRAYTPIKLEQLRNDYDFAIIVKRYIDGLVSNYLCDLQVGECSLWCGPYSNYELNSERFHRLIMIAQGTGIAPFFSIIKHVLNDEENLTKLVLLYCCKNKDTILLRDELYAMKSYWNFDYVIYLSSSSDDSMWKYKEPISLARLTITNVLELKPFSDRDQFLLCGSENFMSQYSETLQEHIPCVNVVKF